MVAAVVGGGSAVAGLAGDIFGGITQANSASDATAAQMAMFQQTQHNLAPFIQGGKQSFNQLLKMLPSLSAPFQPTMAQLAATPGYQFALDQGLQATQNGFAAQGLGQSGPALKGAANYAEGLASTTYQQQFQNYLAQQQQRYNMYAGPASLGESAAAGQGQLSAEIGGQIGSNIIGAGNALAGAAVGGANALSSGAGNYLQYSLLQQMLANQAQQNSLLGASNTPDFTSFSGGR